MAGGLPIVQASSEAWPEYGAQEARALNTGWILDQRFDGAGGFISNASATSSGLTFQSTGDATAFYVIGRPVRVIQAAGTAVFTVGQSSASGGITSVYAGSFSTATGYSTAMSTGAITSAAVSPIYPASTDNNTYGVGSITATTGAVGSLALQFASTTLASQTFSSGGAGTSLISKTLAAGRWVINAGSLVGSTFAASAHYATLTLNDGTNIFATAYASSSVVQILSGSTTSAVSLAISAVVEPTVATAYNLNLSAGTTTLKAFSLDPKNSSTGATYFTAVKIG